MDIQQLHKELEDLFPTMVELRRDFHQHPELSFEEVETPKKIANYLKNLGLEVRTGVGGRGVVGTLRGGKDGKTVALRADFDALPIQDEKDVSYKSTVPGKMHACGHDGHTATLLGVATVLAKYREHLAGNVVFIHQFAEEVPPGGAKSMIEDGCLDGVDVIFGAHLQSTLPLDHIYTREGYQMAAADSFTIQIQGKGGHGADPHKGIDPIVTASQLVVHLQNIVSRNVDPIKSAVLTVGSIHAGDIGNVIPETATLKGTVRTFDPDVRDLMEKRLKQVTEATCLASGASYDVDYLRGYDALWNHAEEVAFLKEIAREIVGKDQVKEAKPTMGGEDFCYYTQKVPGVFFNVGARLSDPERVYPHHHPRFDFNEEAMLTTAKIFVSVVLNVN